MTLIEAGVDFIFYPSVCYETKDCKDADNHYNCPIVTSYPENIRNNVEELRSHNIAFRNPFFNLNNKKSVLRQLCEMLPRIAKNEIYAALDKAYKEFERFKADVRREGERALEYIRENGIIGVVLAGRPYHADPEIHHGIPEMIVHYGAAVLSEDSVAHLGADKVKNERPLLVVDQWAYHSRLYAAACFARGEENIHLVQLNSFGCGLDAVTTDEVRDLLISGGADKIYTVLKIDEVNNLGSARIRIRSLFAAIEERRRAAMVRGWQASNSPPPEGCLRRRRGGAFTKKMRKEHTILTPQMSPIHFDLVAEAFRAHGYNIAVMPAIDREAVDVGLKYVNNDACYPAVIVVGQFMKALNEGKYDRDNTSLIITQTGGGCRASNYIGFIRKALIKAGLAHIPVISVSGQGLEKNPGFGFTLPLLKKALQALLYGDLFMRVLYRVRPYETVKGSADELHAKWLKRCSASIRDKGSRFKENVREIIRDFDSLPIRGDMKKPRVGVVGEILVKYHPTANNDIVGLLESEGAEAVVPDLIDFFLYGLHNNTFKADYLGGTKLKRMFTDFLIDIIERFRAPMVEALNRSERFGAPVHIREMGKLAEPVLSLGNQTGEGWFLTAEMIELIKSGVPNIVCTQPFACLPNHVTGKGMIKELRRLYPLSNIVAVDYDPGASEVNQLNRIKLMLAAAVRNMGLSAGIPTEKIREVT
jgi:predicted nucleotide-binding protein (sugar kinase/HSP70/actin superfamily)